MKTNRNWGVGVMEYWRIGQPPASRVTPKPGVGGIPASSALARPLAGFTLIELLAVMLIAVLLISLGYAGYNEMRKTTGVGTAARNVADALSQARQAAVASGHRTRFLITQSGDKHQYAIVREVPGLRISGQRYWETISEWQRLPLGVGFAGTLPPTADMVWRSGNATQIVYTNAPPAPWYTNTYNVASAVSPPPSTIEFSRQGRPSQTWTVTVARGYYSGSSFVTSGADYAWVIVDGQTGKTRVERK
jgi:prepilin-type N-terminal cleavage/methylation domain-containing protein